MTKPSKSECEIDKLILEEYNATRHPSQSGKICHAPFNTMVLTQLGEIYSCGVNRTALLGLHPQQSIRDAWFGKEATELRKRILNNDLSYGCEQCRDYLLMKNFWNIKARVYDEMMKDDEVDSIPESITESGVAESKELFPTRIDFNLSNTCNLECAMCTGWLSSSILKNRFHLKEKENPWGEQFLTEIQEFLPHLKTAFFAGGEPFLIQNYFQLWEDILKVSPDCHFIIQTNGTVLNDRIKNIIEKGKFYFNISIDSVRKETFESIRVNANFEKSMQNFDYFVDYAKRKQTFVNLTVCPIQQNWREIPELIRFANEKGVSLYFNTVLYPQRYSFLGLNNSQIDEIISYFSSFDFPETTNAERISKSSFLSLIDQLKSIYKDDELRDKYLEYDLGQELVVERTRRDQEIEGLIAENARLEALEKKRIQEEQEMLQRIEQEKTEKELQQMKLQKEKFAKRTDSDIACFFISEIDLFLSEISENQLREKEQIVNKLDLLLAYTNPLTFEDILKTIYTGVSLPNIIQGLLTKNVEELFASYLFEKENPKL